MRKKLKLRRTALYYQNRLKELSVNNEIYDVVIEEQGNSFVLYRNAPPVARWERMMNSRGYANSYKAIITFEDQDIFMDIKMKTDVFWATLLGCLAIIGFSVYLMLKGEPTLFPGGFLIIVLAIFYRWERSCFKKFIPAFLDNLQ